MTVPEDVAAAVAALRAGQVIGLPTETVYGLAGDASNPDAVARIFAIKGRPSSHPVIVHIAGIEHVSRWAREFPPAAQALARKFWPGPLTLVLPRADSVSLQITGGQDTVALRVPAHPKALAVLRAFDGGLAAPSANRYGRVSPTTAAHVRQDLGDDVAIVLDGGPCHVGLESTIVGCLEGSVTVLRPGRITAADIASIAGPLSRSPAAAPRVPGSVVSHYAPRTPMRLVHPDDVGHAARTLLASHQRVAVLASSPALQDDDLTWIVASPDPEAYGRQLYSHLRALDEAGAALILVAEPPATPEWHAVHDRLTRASAR
jgi:L-threonylcarbamoyladenylate synthase